jgi:hypothetical protein
MRSDRISIIVSNTDFNLQIIARIRLVLCARLFAGNAGCQNFEVDWKTKIVGQDYIAQ